MKIIAKTLEGLEQVLAREIEDLGGSKIKVLKRAVQFEGDRSILYKSNISLRTALRILVVKKVFTARDEEELYKQMFAIPWESIIRLDDTFAIDSTTSSEKFTHSKYVALKSKDAIVDRFKEKYGERPNVNVYTPTYRINIHIRDTTCTLSLDSSGESLHLRGYRMNTVEAPMNEVLAAGIILLSNWDGNTPFMDPMCGSGTLLIEAAKIALNQPAQDRKREFGFKKWKSYDRGLFNQIYDALLKQVRTSCPQISGSDKSLRSIKVTQQNISEARLNDHISVLKKDFFKLYPNKGVTVIMNPPYDERLKEKDINSFYSGIGEKIKKDFRFTNSWIFSANLEALKYLYSDFNNEFEMMNGGLPARFVQFKN